MPFQNAGIVHFGAAAADGVNEVFGVALMIVPIEEEKGSGLIVLEALGSQASKRH